MSKNDSPLEAAEQAMFVQWLEARGLRFTATAQSTYTTSHNQKRKNYQQGVRKGYPDLVVLIDPSKSKDGLGYYLNIEMKRLQGGVQSQEQKDWERAINGLGSPHVQYYLCKGADAAIKVVEHYIFTSVNNPF